MPGWLQFYVSVHVNLVVVPTVCMPAQCMSEEELYLCITMVLFTSNEPFTVDCLAHPYQVAENKRLPLNTDCMMREMANLDLLIFGALIQYLNVYKSIS